MYVELDVHTQLEKKCASFLGTEDAILYSFGFATIASAIPAFCKRGDLIIADTGVAFPIQKGILISRANVKYFKHNDVADLERILEEVKKEDAKSKKPVSRRFIIVEGLYQNYGDIAPLKQLVRQSKFKYFFYEAIHLGRAQEKVQVPPHRRGVAVAGCPWQNRPRHYRACGRTRVGRRDDRWWSLQRALGRRWHLCWIPPLRRSPASLWPGIFLLFLRNVFLNLNVKGLLLFGVHAGTFGSL